MRGKWFWGASFAFWASILSHLFIFSALISNDVLADEVLERKNSGSVKSYESLIFLRGVRNADSEQVLTPEIYYTGGPTEPSLPSITGGSSIINQYVPLTTESAENVRTGIAAYTVKPGDAPSVIAASFGITTNTLLWANNLQDGDYIKPGDELIILPVSGIRYKVRSGDTISSIAARYKGEIDEIIAFNGLRDNGAINTGDYIVIPDGEMSSVSYNSRSSSGPKYIYTKNLDGYFIHPLGGAGYKSRGVHPTNAVDIAGQCWLPVYAAADGTVEISDGYGWNGGYGKYVKIAHPNGTKTVYAHSIQNEVSAGQSVTQGQLIAYMGSTGRSTGCHVHWEVYGALNPLR